MERVKGLLTAAAVILALSAQPLFAQQSGSVEIGLDGVFGVELFGEDEEGFDIPNTTFANLPSQRVRIGLWMSDELSIEPGIGFSWFDFGEDDTVTLMRLDLSLLYHFGQVGATRPYVRGGGVFDLLNFDESMTQFGAGGGVGVKIPATDNLGFRLEAGATRFFENDDFFSYTTLNALVGLSIFIN